MSDEAHDVQSYQNLSIQAKGEVCREKDVSRCSVLVRQGAE